MHRRGSRYQGNVQEIHPTGGATSHLHGGCTTGSQSDDTTTFGHSLDLEKRRRRATPESRSGESCAVSQSEPRHPSTEKRHSPIRTYVSRHTQRPTSQSELPIVSLSPHYYQDKPHTVAAETSHDNAVKHDIIGVNGGHKISDEGPKSVRPMLPRKAIEVDVETDPNAETKVDQSYTQDVDWVRTYGNRLREADELDIQQRIAGVKRKASQDHVCTFAFVHGRERSNTYGVI